MFSAIPPSHCIHYSEAYIESLPDMSPNSQSLLKFFSSDLYELPLNTTDRLKLASLQQTANNLPEKKIT